MFVLWVVLGTTAPANGNSHPATDNQIGVTFGATRNPTPLSTQFGRTGSALALHMKQNIYRNFGVHISYGWIGVGTGSDPEFGLDVFNQYYTQERLLITYMALGPCVDFRVRETHALLLSASIGFYDMFLELTSPLGADNDLSTKSFGYGFKTAYSIGLGDTISLRLQIDAHYVLTSSTEPDLYYLLSERDKNPLLMVVSAGIQASFN